MQVEFSHAFCDNCDEIKEVFAEKLQSPSTTAEFLGGDVVCKECASIVSTIYVRNIQ